MNALVASPHPGTRCAGLKRLARLRGEDDGVAMVEFALVLPLLLMLVTGIIQFGLVFNTYINLSDAVRIGARSISLGRGAASDPCVAAASKLAANDAVTLPNAKVSTGYPAFKDTNGNVGSEACGSPGAWKAGDSVTWKIEAPYTLQIFGLPLFTGTLTAQATDPIE